MSIPVKPIALGAFDLSRPFARGGSGQVWEGVHRGRNLPVAVKVVTAERARDPEHVRGFAHEARSVAKLRHRGIVVVLDYGTVDLGAEEASRGKLVAGSPYLVMERAKGSLRQERPRFEDWPELRDVLLELLDALGHAHARGVIHRDLKLDNLLRFDDGSVKLADFGLAHALGSAKEHLSGGTPLHMAPEQWHQEWRDHGPWTDLYALGGLAWAWLTGGYLFGARRGPALMVAHLQRQPGRFKPRFAVPEGVEAWLRLLLAKSIHQRFRRSADAAWALGQLGDEVGESPAAVEPVEFASMPTVVTPRRRSRGRRRKPVHSKPRRIPQPPLPIRWQQPTPPASPQLIGAGLGLYSLRVMRLVGRHAERDVLWRRLDAVVGNRLAHVVVLRGDAGVGKTRLARWLCKRAHEAGAATVLRARHGRLSGPRDGLVPMIETELVCQGLPREEVAGRVGARVPDAGSDERERLLELLRPQWREDEQRGLTRQDRLDVLERFVAHLARSRPVILQFDDAQWGGEALDFTRRLLSCTDPVPVLILITIRESGLAERPGAKEALDEILRHSDATEVVLSPLRGEERKELVRELLGLEEKLAEQVERRTAGVPLFAVQLVGDWVRRGLLEVGETGFRLREGAKAELPDELHAVWVDRVNQFLAGRDSSEREALELAATLGPSVEEGEWRAVCERVGIGVPEGLVDRLVLRDLATRSGRTGWTFVHGMLGESLVREAREAGRLRGQQAEISRTLYELGNARLRKGRPRSAEGLLHRALALAAGLQSVEVRTSYAEALVGLGRTREAQEHYGTALDACREDGDRVTEGRILGLLGSVYWQQGRVEEASKHQVAALDVHREVGNRRLEGVVLGNLGTLRCEQGRLHEARALYDAALIVHREVGNRAFEGVVLGNLGILHRQQGRMHESLAHFEAALAVHREEGNRHSEGTDLGNIGALHFEQGRTVEALAHFREALAVHREIGSRRSEGIVLTNLGELHRAEGRLAEARVHLEAGLAVHREIEDRRLESMDLAKLGDLFLEVGELAAARDAMIEALDLLERFGIQRIRGTFLGTLALVWSRLGDHTAARACLEEGEGLVREVGDPVEILKVLCVRGMIELGCGESAAAMKALQEAEAMANMLELRPQSTHLKPVAELRAAAR